LSAGIPSVEECVSHYGQHLEMYSEGRLKAPSAHTLDFYVGFSFFRACAILQGVYKRSLQGIIIMLAIEYFLPFSKYASIFNLSFV
jgi:hypothetical protein